MPRKRSRPTAKPKRRRAPVRAAESALPYSAAEVAKLEEALRLADARFAGIVGISADAIITIDQAQRIVLFNSGAEEIFGYRADEVIGRPLSILLPEGARTPHIAHVRGFGESGTSARRMGARAPIEGRRSNGEVFPAEASISQMNIGDQRFFTAVLRDETERTRLLRARDDVLAVVSHDLRNPLAAIAMCATTLIERPPESESARREILGTIRESVTWMNRIIQDLLDIAHIERGRLSMRMTRTSVDDILTRARPSLDALTQRHAFGMVADPALPEVSADAERVAQVLANLVGNAVKYTPPEGAISVRAERSGASSVRFTVTDRGSGIPAASMPHIFERFWHDKRESGLSGTGLGLAIAKGIVEAHGGEIGAKSEVGRGTSIWFTLPVPSTA